MCVGCWIGSPGREGDYGMNKSTVEMRMVVECLGDSDGDWLIRVRGRIDVLSRISESGV